MFKPENIFLVHGHGETSSYGKLKQTPFGPVLYEFQRFNVPPLVFTASSREVGMNTPPHSDLTESIRTQSDVDTIHIPTYTGTYDEYTNSLRTLGTEVFDVMVPSGPDGILSTMWMILESSSPTGALPRKLHTHGPMIQSYKTQPAVIQKRDYFLFSHPDDSLDLNTLLSVQNKMTQVPSNPYFSYQKGFMISGVIPVSELREPDRTLFSFDVLLPTFLFSKKLSEWHTEFANIPIARLAEWKDLLLNSGLVTNNSEILSIPKGDDTVFCREYLTKIKGFFRRIYFWSTKYKDISAFYSHTISKFPMRLKSKNIAHWVKNIRPKEPKLILFYHCRSINPRVSGLGNWYNNDYMNAISRIESAKGAPILARSFSTSASEGLPLPVTPGGFRRRRTTRKRKVNRRVTRKTK
jgi:hypothetical protein